VALRRACAQGLLEIGFDGYGFGGWPLDSDGNLLEDMLSLTRELIPTKYPMHGLGVGHPGSIVKCNRMGYALFDSALPTRDARRGRLYVFGSRDPDFSRPHKEWLYTCYLQDERYMKVSEPLDANCVGLCCQRYSTSALHHLFRIEDPLFLRLATIHNLSQMTRLCRSLRAPAGPDLTL
jgi:queuine tRNA-ribosyltransferase